MNSLQKLPTHQHKVSSPPKDSVTRMLDYGNSPVHSLRDLAIRVNTQGDKQLKPGIQPVSMKPSQSASRLAESQVSVESITQQLERRSHQRQKENIRNVENMPGNKPDQRLWLLIKDLESQVIASPLLSRQVQSVAKEFSSFANSQQELINLWKGRSIDLESKTQEYNKLRGILDSLQQKLTVLMEENTRLNNLVLKNNDQSELKQQLEKLTLEKNEATKRFSMEREMLEKQRDQLQSQLRERSNISVTSQSNSSNRELAFKLEQAEVKLLTLQINNDNLRQDLSHKQLDIKTIENLKDKITILETKVQELISEKEHITIENERLSDQYQKALQDIQIVQQNLNQKCDEFQRERNQLESDLRRSSDSHQREVKVRQEIEFERNKLKELLGQQNHEFLKLQSAYNNLKEQLSQLNLQLQQAHQAEANVKNECEQLQKHYRLLRQEKDETDAKKNSEIQQLQQNVSRLQQQYIQASSDLNNQKQKFQIIQNDLQNMRERLNVRAEEERKIEFTLNQTQSKLQECEATIIQLENEKAKLYEEYQRAQQEFKRKFDQQNHESNKKLQELNDITEELKTYKQRYSETLKMLDSVERKLLERIEFEIRN